MDPEKIFKKRNLASLAPVIHVQLFVVDEGEAGEAVGQPLHHLLHLVDKRYPHLSHLVQPLHLFCSLLSGSKTIMFNASWSLNKLSRKSDHQKELKGTVA
jgi:hypothetical protein